jgi:hypothetical protein
MTVWLAALRHEWFRLRFRFELLWRGVVAITLWLGIAYLWSVVAPIGLGAVLLIPLGLLAFAGLPVLVVQAGLLVDLLLFLLVGQISFYPQLLESLRASARQRHAPAGSAPWEPPASIRVLVWTVDALSPFSALATWAFAVLARMPESTYVVTAEHPTHTTHFSAGRSLRRVEGSVLSKSWQHRGPLAA